MHAIGRRWHDDLESPVRLRLPPWAFASVAMLLGACAMPAGTFDEDVTRAHDAAVDSPRDAAHPEVVSADARTDASRTDTLPARADVVATDAPRSEACNGVDDDGNGRVDEGCACAPGESQRCYLGPAVRAGVGACTWGMQRCGAGSELSTWGECTGSHGPSTEVCDGVDNDCDGATDPSCICTPGESRRCYPGPATTAGVGVCHAGTQSCVAGMGSGSLWGACAGAVLPTHEVCGNHIDDDCNGRVDDGCTPACRPSTLITMPGVYTGNTCTGEREPLNLCARVDDTTTLFRFALSRPYTVRYSTGYGALAYDPTGCTDLYVICWGSPRDPMYPMLPVFSSPTSYAISKLESGCGTFTLYVDYAP